MAFCEMLIDCPRYYELQTKGILVSKYVQDLSLPVSKELGECMSHAQVISYLQVNHRHKVLAFAMCRHERLGAESVASALSTEIIEAIMHFYFGLDCDPRRVPGDHEAYLDVVKATEWPGMALSKDDMFVW